VKRIIENKCFGAFRAKDKRLVIMEGIEAAKEMAEYNKYLRTDEY